MSVKVEDKPVEVCFFASLREAIGQERIQLEGSYASVEILLQQLMQQFPILISMQQQQTLLVAVNQQMVRWQHPVKAGDEVAFFPPVTGG